MDNYRGHDWYGKILEGCFDLNRYHEKHQCSFIFFTTATGVRFAVGLSVAYLLSEFIIEFNLIRCVAKILLCLAFLPMYVKKDNGAARWLAFWAWTAGLPGIYLINYFYY